MIPRLVRAEVIGRDNSSCVACGVHVDTSSGWYSLQHRRARGMGGSTAADTNRPTNLITMCGDGVRGCHGRAERDKDWARPLGYRVESWEDPAAVPVLVFGVGRVLLTDDATYDYDVAA